MLPAPPPHRKELQEGACTTGHRYRLPEDKIACDERCCDCGEHGRSQKGSCGHNASHFGTRLLRYRNLLSTSALSSQITRGRMGLYHTQSQQKFGMLARYVEPMVRVQMLVVHLDAHV